MKKYTIIYADPPWKYEMDVKQGVVGNKYAQLSVQDISNLPVKNIVSDNCALFLWTTFPKLEDIFTNNLFEKWGFVYRTIGFTWIKLNKQLYTIYKDWVVNHPSTDDLVSLLDKLRFFGIGYYAKSNAEICLLGIRGQMKPISNSVSSIIFSPRARHSEKPAETRTRIVNLFGDVPRIELFSRHQTSGWDATGLDYDRIDIRNFLTQGGDKPL